MSSIPELSSTGRTNLDHPPKPTTPPEAAPRVAQLNQAKEENSTSIGSLQQAGVILQTGMAVEKGLLMLASIVPGFDQLVQQILPQIQQGIQAGLSQGSSQQGGPAPAGGEQLPQTSVSPLQQG